MNSILNSNKLMDRFFRRVDNVVWDLMSGRVGVRTSEGITTIEGEGDDAEVVVNLFDQFGMEVPAFAQNTPIDAVKVGDLIYGTKGALGWVVKKNTKSFELLKTDGTRTTWSPPKVQMLGFEGGVMVLRSLLNILPGGSSGLANMQSTLLPLLAMSDGNIDLSQIMPLMLLSQVGGVAADGTTTVPAGGMNNMLQLMLLGQMLGGKKGNPFGSNFFDRSK